MTRVLPTDQTGATGVTIVQLLVESELGWIFRRIDHRDTGLDAEVEIVIAGEATGIVLGLQIKSGPSYFSEPTDRGWWYRGDRAHLKYWRDHTLSTVVVLVDTESRTASWAAVPLEDAAVHYADKSWKIEVLRDDQVGSPCRTRWMEHAWAQCPRDALFRYCALHRRFIDVLSRGGEVFLEAEEWVNKMRGQAGFCLIVRDASDEESRVEFAFLAGIHDPYEFAKVVFPWADIDIDEDYYELHEDVEPEAVFQDDDEPGGYHIVEGERPTGIRPYGLFGSGEVAGYRFTLTLNALGTAFATFEAVGATLPQYPPYYIARTIVDES